MQFWSSEIEKQVGKRVQIVLTDPDLLKAFQTFGGDVTRRSSVFHGLNEFLTDQKVRGRCCLEIGTWNGLTAVVLSRYFDHVVSVDIEHNPMREQIIELLGIKNISFIDIRDNADKKAVARDLQFDFAYMDGDHANDTQSDWDLVRGCGRVLFHEAWPFQKEVFNLVHALNPAQVHHNGMGLALWDVTRK